MNKPLKTIFGLISAEVHDLGQDGTGQRLIPFKNLIPGLPWAIGHLATRQDTYEAEHTLLR